LKAARMIALLLAGAGFFTGCGNAARHLRLVTLTELTGPHAASGDGIRKAAGMALEEYREALDNAGWHVELAAFDANLPAQDFSAVISRIASQPDVVCAVLHTTTAGIFASIPPLRTAGIPAVFPAETTPLPENDPPPGTLWLSPDDRIHGAADAEWIAAGGFAGVLLLVEPDGHSQAIADGFLQRAETLSLPVTQFQLSPQQYSSPWILSLNTAAAQLVYFSGSVSTISSLLRDLEGAGFQGTFFFAEGEAEDQIPASVGSGAIPFIFSPAAFHSENGFRDGQFAEKFQTAYRSNPPPLSELGFDASALCLRPLLRINSGDPNPSVTRDAIRSAWRAGGTWDGFGGSYSFDGIRPCRTWIFAPLGDAVTGRAPSLAPYPPAEIHTAC